MEQLVESVGLGKSLGWVVITKAPEALIAASTRKACGWIVHTHAK